MVFLRCTDWPMYPPGATACPSDGLIIRICSSEIPNVASGRITFSEVAVGDEDGTPITAIFRFKYSNALPPPSTGYILAGSPVSASNSSTLCPTHLLSVRLEDLLVTVGNVMHALSNVMKNMTTIRFIFLSIHKQIPRMCRWPSILNLCSRWSFPSYIRYIRRGCAQQ